MPNSVINQVETVLSYVKTIFSAYLMNITILKKRSWVTFCTESLISPLFNHQNRRRFIRGKRKAFVFYLFCNIAPFYCQRYLTLKEYVNFLKQSDTVDGLYNLLQLVSSLVMGSYSSYPPTKGESNKNTWAFLIDPSERSSCFFLSRTVLKYWESFKINQSFFVVISEFIRK